MFCIFSPFFRNFAQFFLILHKNKPFQSTWAWPEVRRYISTTLKVVKMAISLAIRQKIIDFYKEGLSKEKWPSSSPDANPMDFSVQSILETKVCKKNYSSVKSLTKSLQQEWKKLSEDQIRKICAAAPNRLKAIAEKEGHHVE